MGALAFASGSLDAVALMGLGGAFTSVGTLLAGQASAPSANSHWPRQATRVLALEGLILAVLNVAWVGYAGRPTGLAAGLMLFFAALALGSQSAAARNISGTPSTTYMTGAMTTLIEAVCRRRRADPSVIFGLVGLVAGAALSAALVTHLRLAAMLPTLLAVAVVIVVKIRDHGQEASPAQP